MSAAAFAAAFAALLAAHSVGDHWVQTGRQAAVKGLPGWPGRAACAGHVITLTLTKCAALAAVALATGLHLATWQACAALAADAAAHYWADRRVPLARLAARAGKSGFYQLGVPRPGRDDLPTLGTGAYALDQSWHTAWLFTAALIIALGA